MVIVVICFPLSYKLSTGASSVYVLKWTSKASSIRQGQQSNRSQLDVGFFFFFCNVNKGFCNSGICISTSKRDSKICTGQFKHYYGGSIRIFISLWF